METLKIMKLKTLLKDQLKSRLVDANLYGHLGLGIKTPDTPWHSCLLLLRLFNDALTGKAISEDMMLKYVY